jgi:hypothetical protein
VSNAKVILLILVVSLCLAAADLWLLGKIHFCRLWLTRAQNLEERQALESKATALTYTFVIVNLSAVGALVVFGIKTRSKKNRRYASSSNAKQ